MVQDINIVITREAMGFGESENDYYALNNLSRWPDSYLVSGKIQIHEIVHRS